MGPPTSASLASLCQGVDAIVIQGKRLAANPVAGSELYARTAAAAWLYHSGLARYLVCVEDDINRPYHPAGSAVAAELLSGEFGVPAAAIVARSWANCTRVEVRAIRVLARAHGWRRLAALTSGYHAPRARRLYAQLGLQVAVVACAEESLVRLIPPGDPELYRRWVEPALRAARLSPRKHLEERAKEAVLVGLLVADPRGVLELALARAVRGR